MELGVVIFFFRRVRFTVACSPRLECGLWLGLGAQLLGLNFCAFRGARGVFVSLFFSFTLAGAWRKVFGWVSQIWV